MTDYHRLLETIEIFDLPQQDIYELEVNKKSYYRLGGVMMLLAGWLGYLLFFSGQPPEMPEDWETVNKLVMLVPIFLLVLGLGMVIGASKAKVVIDKNGIVIPDDIIPFAKKKVEWVNIEQVKLIPVTSCSDSLSMIVQMIFPFVLSNTKLMLVRRDLIKGEEEFGILDVVKDRKVALKIIRFNLGERFRV